MDITHSRAARKAYGDFALIPSAEYDEINYVSPRYMALVAAILEQAENDYKNAIKSENAEEIKKLRKWFLSEWGQALSGDHGETIIKRLDKEMDYEMPKNEESESELSQTKEITETVTEPAQTEEKEKDKIEISYDIVSMLRPIDAKRAKSR